MIWSGLLIYWASPMLSFLFPEWFYKLLNIPFRLAEGMAFHFLFMWFFIINGVMYVLYTLVSGEWRELISNRHSFKEAWQVLLHDLHLRKNITTLLLKILNCNRSHWETSGNIFHPEVHYILKMTIHAVRLTKRFLSSGSELQDRQTGLYLRNFREQRISYCHPDVV
jgi:hypothetical protein